MKSLKDISWQVSEPEYRKDPALSYSTLSTYEREGRFEKLNTLFDRKESPSLVWGSALDTYLTDGEDAYNNSFLVAAFPECSDSIVSIVKSLFAQCHDTYHSLLDIPDEIVIPLTQVQKYQLNWKPETRVKVIKEKGEDYYNLLFLAQDKIIISSEVHTAVMNAAEALKTAECTKEYFKTDNPFEPEIERLYQLKFKATIEGVNYRIMMDEAYVDHKNKTIRPIDLKSSSKREYNFPKSFLEWGYMWQGKLYTKVLRENILKDEYFKDFTILPYIFIVVNNKGDNPTPLCWEFSESVNTEDYIVGDRIYRSPLTIGAELNEYLHTNPRVPKNISMTEPNNITNWLEYDKRNH